MKFRAFAKKFPGFLPIWTLGIRSTTVWRCVLTLASPWAGSFTPESELPRVDSQYNHGEYNLDETSLVRFNKTEWKAKRVGELPKR